MVKFLEMYFLTTYIEIVITNKETEVQTKIDFFMIKYNIQ